MVYRLKRTQKLPISIREAWNFFSNPANLREITPKYMGFKILEGTGKDMFPGQIIKYIVRPLLGIPLRWVTEITHVEKESYFVDEQRYGPYKLWHHKHFFNKIKDGVEMIDIVDYTLPFGLLGRMAHPLFIKKKLNQIFDYRYKVLENKFGIIKK